MQVQIIKKNNLDVVSSRVIAEGLEKRHDHLINDIRKILEDSPNLGNAILFISSKYKNSNNREFDEYLLTADGFTLLMMNYQGYNEFKIAYIQEFNRMKNQYGIETPKSLPEALRLAADLAEKNEKLEYRVLKDKPYTNLGKAVAVTEGAIPIGDFAQNSFEEFGLGQNSMFRWLRAQGFLKQDNSPYQKYLDKRLFSQKPNPYTNRSTGKLTYSKQTNITGKGQTYIVAKLNEYFKKNIEEELLCDTTNKS